jgi:hypothetical protein
MICQDKSSFESGLDLDVEPQTSSPSRDGPAWDGDASRQARFRAGHGASTTVHIPALCGALRRRTQGQELLVSGSVLRDGFRAIDVSRVAARYRGVPGNAGSSAVSPGISLACGPQHAGQRERVLSIAISQCTNTQRHADLPKCVVPSIANIARGYRLDRDRKTTQLQRVTLR